MHYTGEYSIICAAIARPSAHKYLLQLSCPHHGSQPSTNGAPDHLELRVYKHYCMVLYPGLPIKTVALQYVSFSHSALNLVFELYAVLM